MVDMDRVSRLVERGEGYWCYRMPVVAELQPPTAEPEEPPELNLPDAQLVYRPVTVEVDDSGDPWAYYYDADADPEEMADHGGKRQVPLRQVYVTPLRDAEPAYKYD